MKLPAGKPFSLQVMAWLALLSCGCASGVRFSADTTIDAHGEVTRVTRIAAAGNLPDDYIPTHYALLPGGRWSRSVGQASPARPLTNGPASNPFSSPLVYDREYSVTRTFASGEPIAADFRRSGPSPRSQATNRISVRTRHLWFVDLYRYEERYRDVVTIASLRDGVRRLHALYVRSLAEAIVAMTDSVGSAEDAALRLRARSDALVESLLDGIGRECVGEGIDAAHCVEALLLDEESGALLPVVSDEAALVAELARIFPAPAGTDPGAWAKRLAIEVIDVAEARLDELSGTDELLGLETAVFGVHGFLSFRAYPFELTATLPGRIVASNADSLRDGVLSWQFSAQDFLLNDRVLHASSRILHPERIALGALVAALIVFVAGWLALRGRPRESAHEPL